jgi:homoaconitase/3-isopropylmalate dehydratase large subunit
MSTPRSVALNRGFGGNATSFLTRYDRHSVMHYQFTSCGINGNYDNTGLSDLDQLAVHILYPEDQQVAEYIGTTVVVVGTRLTLSSAWLVRGADLAFVGRNFTWQVDGMSLSNGTVLNVQLPQGEHQLRYTHGDFLGRSFSYDGPIHVLSPNDFAAQAAVVAAYVPLTL